MKKYLALFIIFFSVIVWARSTTMTAGIAFDVKAINLATNDALISGVPDNGQFQLQTTSATASAGAIYSDNGENFTVAADVAASGSIVLFGASSPGLEYPSGTLTLVSGTGDSTIAFSNWNFFGIGIDIRGVDSLNTGTAGLVGGSVNIYGGASNSSGGNGGSLLIAGGPNIPSPSNSGGIAIAEGNQLAQIDITSNSGIFIQDEVGNSVACLSGGCRTFYDEAGNQQIDFGNTDNIVLSSHLYVTEGSPSSSPTISSCGSGATISNASGGTGGGDNPSDTASTINVGSGTVTTCTINFGVPFHIGGDPSTNRVIPHCFINVPGNTTLIYSANPSTTQLVINFSGNVAGLIVDYFCIGNN
jgi:hypothetical protein